MASIWEKVDDTKVELNKQELEELFGREEAKKSVVGAVAGAPPPEVKKEKIKLLDPDRGRNIEIILTKLRTPNTQLCEVLRTCQGRHCNQGTLDNLQTILPTDDEASMVRGYTGDLTELAAPESFFL